MRKRTWTVGGYGHSVTVTTRNNSPYLYLTYNVGKRKRWRSLGHADWNAAKDQAREMSAGLLAATTAKRTGKVTVAQVFGAWLGRAQKRARPQEEYRRIETWTEYLKGERDAMGVDLTTIEGFIEWRRERGYVRTKGGKVRAPSDYTIAADIRWLKTVYNRAVSVGLLKYSPLNVLDAAFMKQLATTPKQPLASEDHFERVLPFAGRVNPRFPFWFRFLNLLGWRETALCELRRSDFDTRKRENAPYGQVLKRGEIDKQGVDMWVPMSAEVRQAFDDFMRAFPSVGDVRLFPAPRAKGKAWSRFYASSLLGKAETAAGLDQHYPPHSYRRKWATERKHLPRADVAAAGGWKSERTLEIYQKADPATMLLVVSEPKKLRELVAQSGAGEG